MINPDSLKDIFVTYQNQGKNYINYLAGPINVDETADFYATVLRFEAI
jgi:hypothetical protein